MEVLIFAILIGTAAVATSQPVAVDPDDDPALFPKILDTLYPGRLPDSYYMMNYLTQSIADANVTSIPGSEADRSILLECQKEIGHKNLTSCGKIKLIYKTCMRPYAQKYFEINNKDISADEQEISDLKADSLAEVIEFLCGSDAQKLKDLRDSCLRQAIGPSSIVLKKKFYEEAPKFALSPTKATLCQILSSVRPALETGLKDKCSNDAAVEAYLGYFDAVLKPCKK